MRVIGQRCRLHDTFSQSTVKHNAVSPSATYYNYCTPHGCMLQGSRRDTLSQRPAQLVMSRCVDILLTSAAKRHNDTLSSSPRKISELTSKGHESDNAIDYTQLAL